LSTLGNEVSSNTPTDFHPNPVMGPGDCPLIKPHGPFPEDDPLPGAYRLHWSADGVSIWYTVTPYEGQEVITIQYVKADT
jgi:hypothetical protein